MQRTDAARVRRRLLEQIGPQASAWSIDGRSVELLCEPGADVENGGFATVVPADGRRLLVQIDDLRVASRDTVRVDVDPAGLGFDEGLIRSADVGVVSRYLEGTGRVLGLLDGEPGGGFEQATIEPAADADVEAFVRASLGDQAGLAVGRLRSADAPALLKPTGFARHSFLCGQSGSGKTFSLGVVLERLLLDTDLQVVIIDPNSDYVNLGTPTSLTAINRFRPTPMTRAEHDRLTADYTARADVVVASRRRGDLPLTIHLSDLTLEEQGLVMRLDPLADADEFSALLGATEAIHGPYGPRELVDALVGQFDEASRRLAQRIRNLGVADWSIWASADEPSLVQTAAGRHRVTILDTGSLAESHERSVVR